MESDNTSILTFTDDDDSDMEEGTITATSAADKNHNKQFNEQLVIIEKWSITSLDASDFEFI